MAERCEEVREEDLVWKPYTVEDLPLVTALIDKELSEPYSIYTYRYFLNQWPQLCILVRPSRVW
jgi:peptide alpha-N-acetyltransferase